jgi:tyrosinase
MTFCDEEHLLSCADFTCFLKRIDGWEAGDPNIFGLAPSLHPNGHFTMGGLQNDPFVSPGDPSFYFHHAQLDRMWAVWQAQDPARQYAVGGTRDPFNSE